MKAKVLLTWDIAPDHEQEYFEFVIGEFVPGVQRLGFQPTEAWATVYGDYPQIQVALIAEGEEEAKEILRSEGWNQLTEKLFPLVQNFDYKIVPAKGGFQF